MLLSKYESEQPIGSADLRFQSLFFWMLLSKLMISICVRYLLFVSFNPYFSGCFSLSIQNIKSKITRTSSFNPYFSGCFSLRLNTNGSFDARIFLFQSLFFWMLLSKRMYILVPVRLCGLSFNPYFSGCFSLSQCRYSPVFFGDWRFQSLFFWMLLSKRCR